MQSSSYVDRLAYSWVSSKPLSSPTKYLPVA